MALKKQGSPPPMRGKDYSDIIEAIHVRITPAHAGKSCRSRTSIPRREDHPRPCGEKAAVSTRRCAARGSPPPMRGKGAGSANCRGAAGITPAHAGNSRKRSSFKPLDKDHPRSCGEKSAAEADTSAKAGSPPLMRGKVAGRAGRRDAAGITPAHAGKSLTQ